GLTERGDRVRRLFSRTGEDISRAFPDILDLLTFDACIDGELLVVSDGQVRPFADLQKRLNRKTAGPKLIREYPAAIRAYDLLSVGGTDLREQPFAERRKALETFITGLPEGSIELSPMVKVTGWEEITSARADPHAHLPPADADAVEGLMLKRWDSPYVTGRPKGLWFKWKRDPLLADCVLMYAQRGHGKRSSYYSDYTFGCWRTTAEGGDELVPVGKAYSGFTNDELSEIDRWVRKHATERFGPVRAVEIGLVFEVAFDSIHPSTRHKSGLAMRFPRIHRIRWDKPAEEADRVATLEGLIVR
ncbi:MAG: DNA ligase B, partial [Alphaproteobacteria bacterium MarineAlpha4_Bin2]